MHHRDRVVSAASSSTTSTRATSIATRTRSRCSSRGCAESSARRSSKRYAGWDTAFAAPSIMSGAVTSQSSVQRRFLLVHRPAASCERGSVHGRRSPSHRRDRCSSGARLRVHRADRCGVVHGRGVPAGSSRALRRRYACATGWPDCEMAATIGSTARILRSPAARRRSQRVARRTRSGRSTRRDQGRRSRARAQDTTGRARARSGPS